MDHERFAVIGLADEEATALTEYLRRQFPPTVAVMPAHTTLRGSFIDPRTIGEVQASLARELTGVTLRQPLEVEEVVKGPSNLALVLQPTPEIIELHDRLYYALEGLITDAYGDRPGDGYHPHLTLLYSATEADLDAAYLLVQQRGISSVSVRSAALMGRRGGGVEGHWEALSTYDFG